MRVVLLVPILNCRSGKPSSSGSWWIVLASIISKRSKLYSTGWRNSFWGLTTTWVLKPNMTQICVICVIPVFLCLIDQNPLIVSILDSYWRSVVSVVQIHTPQGRVASWLFKEGETENYHFRFPFSLKACESATTRKCEPNRQVFPLAQLCRGASHANVCVGCLIVSQVLFQIMEPLGCKPSCELRILMHSVRSCMFLSLSVFILLWSMCLIVLLIASWFRGYTLCKQLKQCN